MQKITPTQINLHKKSRLLEVHFSDGKSFNLSCEFLRVNSKSAEVVSNNVPISGKINVNIDNIEPQGEYGIRLYFDDGYDTGIFSWNSLYDLGINYQKVWDSYLQKLTEFNLQRGASNKKQTGTITLLYFMDKLIKTTKTQEEKFELTEKIKTIEDLIGDLKKRGTVWKREFVKERMLFTVNKEFAELFTVLEDGDEIAFVPRSI